MVEGTQEKLGVVNLSAESSWMVKNALRKNKSEKDFAAVDSDAMDVDENEISLDPTPDSNNNKRQQSPHPDSHNGRKLARQLAADSQGRSDRPDLNPPPCLPSGGPMAEQRKSLPVYSFRDQLLTTIRNNAVTVVEGETGSGKTTQVPQYVLEDAAERGETGNIIVAQPRRISAMSVAERVAAERGESIGGTIGYTIRLDSKASRNTRMLFCTTGILLKRLEADKNLENVTHVFVDEVHERSIESDFLLMVLRDCMNRRTTPLKIVLMSATLNATLFHTYFNGAPSVKFPGRTYPVTELYLEHAIEATGHQVNNSDDWVRKGNKKSSDSFNPHGAPRPPSPDDEELSFQQLAQRYPQFSSRVHSSLQLLDHNAIDYRLICDTVRWLSGFRGPEGAKQWLERFKSRSRVPPAQPSEEPFDSSANAILVFLPGIKEITTLQEMLVYSLRSQEERDWVLPIHSTVPPEDQRKVFTRPPPGVRKIVLATNIAETAITIDDVAFVIDTGRMKENRYDPIRRMASLDDCLVSRANARQRRGRAGRVREGVAVHLYTKHRHDYIAVGHQLPEVKRVPLEQLVLRIKALKYEGTAAQVCARLVEPPAPAAVNRAVQELRFLEALDENENLTALGVHLSTLPCDCRIGKLILLGAMFGVADEALTIAATLSYRSPFLAPIAMRDEANACKMQFALAQSDHLTALRAYNEVDKMGSSRFDFCRQNYISIKTLQTIAGLKRQLLEHLSAAGFVRQGLRSRSVETMGKRLDGTDGCAAALEHGIQGAYDMMRDRFPRSDGWRGSRNRLSSLGNERATTEDPNNPNLAAADQPPPAPPRSSLQDHLENAQENNHEKTRETVAAIERKAPILKALLVAALFPQLVIAADTKKAKNSASKLQARSADGTKPEEIKIHPQCVAAAKGVVLDSPYLIYHEKVKTSCVFMRDATPVSPHALVLFGGGSLKVDSTKQSENFRDVVLRLDEWIGLSCPKDVYEILLELRGELDAVMRLKIENPKADFSEGAKGLIDAVGMLLEEGKMVQTAVGGEKVRLDKFSQSFSALRGNNNGGVFRNQNGGNQSINGQPMSFWKDCFRCKACNINSSGEIAFIQHCAGSKHAAKNGGRREFAGLVPNEGGVIPKLSHKAIGKIAAEGAKLERKQAKKQGGKRGMGGYGQGGYNNNSNNNNNVGYQNSGSNYGNGGYDNGYNRYNNGGYNTAPTYNNSQNFYNNGFQNNGGFNNSKYGGNGGGFDPYGGNIYNVQQSHNTMTYYNTPQPQQSHRGGSSLNPSSSSSGRWADMDY